MKRTLLILAFIEGSAVMAMELLSGMIVAPFFGNTIITWAIVLAITLGGLAAGYYIGGKLSQKPHPIKIIRLLMFCGGGLLLLLPFWGPSVMGFTINLGLEWGLIISLLLFLFPALLVFGSVSPLLIQHLAKFSNNAGNVTGSVFGISTAGGIATTLLLGLYIIPEWGLSLPSLIGGTVVLISSTILLLPKKKILATATVLVVLAVLLNAHARKFQNNEKVNLQVHHTSEGVLGQVKVIDFGWKVGDEFTQARAILVNNTWQTAVSMKTGVSLLSYVYHLLPVIKMYPQNSDMLVIGLGGGGLIREMQSAGYSPDVVELDGRLPDLAKQYFGLNIKGQMIVDDGRHFLNVNEKKYDAIVLDVFQGEVAPWQLLTYETFKKVSQTLKPNGLLAIEFFGNAKNKQELSALTAVVKTLYKAGFKVQIIDVAEREKLILASNNKTLNLAGVGYTKNYYDTKNISDLSKWLINPNILDTAKVPVLTDNLPALEKMTLQSATAWREYQNKMFRNYFVEFGLPVIQ